MSFKGTIKALALLTAISIIGVTCVCTTNAATRHKRFIPRTTSNAPSINSFSSSATNINSGETVTLKWSTTGASSVEIIGKDNVKVGEAQLPLSGTVEVWPTVSTTYTLTAYSPNGKSTSKSLVVNVGSFNDASITSFSVSSQKVNPGDTVTLSWTTQNAVSVNIIGIEKTGEADLAVNGSIEVWPLNTTTYTLEAVGSNGSKVMRSITVTVNTPSYLSITSFIASSTTVNKGSLVTLSWTTQNASNVKIKTSLGQELPNRPASGSISVTPNQSITYTLIAYDYSGYEVSKSVTVTVK
jgi:plastocyanin